MNRRVKMFVLCAVVAAMYSLPRQAFAEERHPHMQAALQHLEEAKRELQAAEHDKGGHRAKALQLTDQAINQVKAGMRYDTTHEGKKKDRDRDRVDRR